METVTIPNQVEMTLSARMQEAPGHLYAIVDACDEPRVPEKVLELGDSHAVSLYSGESAEKYSALAPYLLRLDAGSLDWIFTCLAGTPWGVFVWSATALDVLRRHFRQFLMVKGPDGKTLYFRFYDPRVLPLYLETCTSVERAHFFGPVEEFLIPGPKAIQRLFRTASDGVSEPRYR